MNATDTVTRQRRAIIIGAGPAGLTAAYEILQRIPDMQPIVFESSGHIGGLAKTIRYKGNRIDMGGHRFFSKSGRVMQWWTHIMPIQELDATTTITYHNTTRSVEATPDGPDPSRSDNVLLVRQRLSRIFFLGKFFDYPISLTWSTIRNLGFFRMLVIGASYLRARLRPRPERSLEDFFINRFGRELYRTFFKDYTEKVWGVPCSTIDPRWGAQRVKGVSIAAAIAHVIRQKFSPQQSVRQEGVETSLIQRFLYPKYGPGHMWEEVARRVQDQGGIIMLRHKVTGLMMIGGDVSEVTVQNTETGLTTTYRADVVFSTMPVNELIANLSPPAPSAVREVAQGLQYRDFITVGVLLKRLRVELPDNWIYIQDPRVRVGRLQIYNNWSPWLVNDPATTWIGLEYFCNEGDDLWRKADEIFIQFAIQELVTIGIIHKTDVLDATIAREMKAYPAYFGSYERFHEIQKFTDSIANLFLIGRNGMHRYNNQDHSMLTAMAAVDMLTRGDIDKSKLWGINTEDEYHESRS